MCAISGQIGYIDDDWIKYAVNHQSYRGPDGFSIYKDEINNVALGHNRLSIIDLTLGGKQPMESENYVLTFNGEIYNYLEMKSYLSQNDDLGNFNNTDNDAKTFLRYVEFYGVEQALTASNGMFAFALWNKKKKELICAVDRFGQKPFYFYQSDKAFYFASVPAVLYTLKKSWSLNYDALQTYWQLGATIGIDQIFDGVKKLCAGEILIYSQEKKSYKISKYYDLTNMDLKKCHRPIEEIEEVLNKAIDLNYIADISNKVSINLFLSGGIDSTYIAKRHRGKFAIHLKSPEQNFAEYIAQKYNIELQVINPENYTINEILRDFVNKVGLPLISAPIPYITSKEARKLGKVAIIANGADELFFGYDRLKNENSIYSDIQNKNTFRGSVFSHNELNKYRQSINGLQSSRLTDLLFYVQFDLNNTLDFAGMANGLEIRAPFLDHNLVELALSIPESVHRKNGNKSILKTILKSKGFTDDFLNRPKQGFSLFFNPVGFEQQKKSALVWAQKNNFLNVSLKNASGRDVKYLESSAICFYYFFNQYGKLFNNTAKNH